VPATQRLGVPYAGITALRTLNALAGAVCTNYAAAYQLSRAAERPGGSHERLIKQAKSKRGRVRVLQGRRGAWRFRAPDAAAAPVLRSHLVAVGDGY